ncbi:hypothetical protein AAKU52_001593 [Pedobacter sp. CG_S7]|uniref:hypothetical protein n=1 Tax=Pedobacter sp. CG_S7 TaxID=3143930 RepID=UPI003392AEFC
MSHKTPYLIFLLLALFLSVPTFTKAQNSRTDKLYSSSGVGFSFPIGETNDYLKPKFSTTLGLNLGLGNNGLFLYPKLSLHAYKYQQQTLDAGFATLVNNGRVTTYLLNIALGYRKIVGDFGFYGFIGGGGGFLLTPEVTLSPSNAVASFNNKTNGMTMMETGMGMEYSFGKVSVFLEGTYMRGFNKIQERRFQTIPLTIGIKPNLSSLINGK